MKPSNVTVALALGALIALPACSNLMGRGSSGSTAGATGPTRTVTAPALSTDMVRQVQSRLQRDGYYKTGNVDGVWGAGTESAVMAFQRDHNLNASGKLDAPTLQAMNIVGPTSTTDVPPGTATRSDVTPPPANWETRPPGTTAPTSTGR